MVVMISATIHHIQRGENSSALITLTLLAMATFVAYMRWKVLPIRPRQVARIIDPSWSPDEAATRP
jgi:hypothetical protein